MNILISDSWLREYLDTKATPRQMAENLSLCSQSVEKITKIGDDWLYEIEVTTNRPDCLSVYGIARELAAILPRFGLPSKLKAVNHRPPITTKSELPLEVKITDSTLCPRFTAIIFDQVGIGPSLKVIKERLEKSGIRALNNVVDISNYLMLELGQPMHTFDYDKIKSAKMVLRPAQEKEKIVTLDGQTRVLPAGAIVIEDGDGRLVDLCGIMGAENSAVDEKTKRVLLFVQTYDPAKIRKTCQQLGFHTEAAARFEKGVDPEGVIPAITKAMTLFEKNCRARIASRLIDLYPTPPKEKAVTLTQEKLNRVMGVKIPLSEAKEILDRLGFRSIIHRQSSIIQATVPHWRYHDINLSEDLIEEVARVYGYHRLPSNLPPGLLVEKTKDGFFWEKEIKNFLKFNGFTETASYSMVSEEILKKTFLTPQNYLKISNPLSDDFVYLRPSLAPSLFVLFAQNQNNFPDARIFEIANIYLPQGENRLPEEIRLLTGGQLGDRFFEIKGVLEALLETLGINDYQFTALPNQSQLFEPGRLAEILIVNKPIGFLGEIDKKIAYNFSIKNRVVLFDLELQPLINYAGQLKKYSPLPTYPAIVEDLAFVVNGEVKTAEIIRAIKDTDSLIVDVKLFDHFAETRTFRITFQSFSKTLSKEEVGKIREKVIKKVTKIFGASLKS